MRRTGIDDKMVFFGRRYSQPQSGSYFEYRERKEVCNPDDTYRFYVKIAGVVFLPKKTVPGKLISTSVERIKDSRYFGSYLYYGETDQKLRVILYTRRKLMPDNKLVSSPGCLHNVIPRYHGLIKDVVIVGMRVREHQTSKRRWTRFDVKTKYHHRGFFELKESDDIGYIVPRLEQFMNRTSTHIAIGIYVPEKTSVIMADITRPQLHNDYSRYYVYTLFQEGAFICSFMAFYFCFYDEEESKEYDCMRLLAEKRHLLNESPHLDRLTLDPNGAMHRIIFLKSAPNHTFWTLRANRVVRSREKEMQLCIPSGGQFEDILPWNEGIEEVKRRQALKPWNKYIQSLNSDHNIPDIDMDLNEAYPQDLTDRTRPKYDSNDS